MFVALNVFSVFFVFTSGRTAVIEFLEKQSNEAANSAMLR